MAYPKWFNEVEYLTAKLTQLRADGVKGPDGELYSNITQVANGMAAAGMTPFEHYNSYGTIEGLSPSLAFSAPEYYSFKLRQLQSDPSTASAWANKSWQELQYELNSTGMSAGEHYERYGAVEGVPMSNAFDGNAYLAAKLELLKATDKTWEGKTVTELAKAMQGLGLDPYTHYMTYKGATGEVPAGATFQPANPVDPVGGRNEVLTTSQDTVIGNSVIVNGLISTTATDTMQVFDNIKVTNSTLNLTLEGTASANLGSIAGGEGFTTVNFTPLTTGTSADLSVFANAKSVSVNGQGINAAGNTFAIKEARLDTVYKVSGYNAKSGVLNMTFADVTKGDSDTVSLELGKNDGDSINLLGLGAGDGVEGLNLKVTGDAKFSRITSSDSGNGTNVLDTVTVTGDKNLTVGTITLVDGGKLDGAAFTGKLNLGITAAGDVTVLGGKGDDRVVLNDIDKKDIIDLGEGVNTLGSKTQLTTGDVAGAKNYQIFEVAGNFKQDVSVLASGIKYVVSDGGAATGLNELANGADVAITANAAASSVELLLKDDITKDSLNLTLGTAGVESKIGTLTAAADTTGIIAKVNIALAGDTIIGTSNAITAKEIIVTGDYDFDAKTLTTATESFDASAAKGDVTVTSAGTTAGDTVTITTGSGSDKVTIMDTTKKVEIDTGDGNDTVIFGAAGAKLHTVTLGDGADTVQFDALTTALTSTTTKINAVVNAVVLDEFVTGVDKISIKESLFTGSTSNGWKADHTFNKAQYFEFKMSENADETALIAKVKAEGLTDANTSYIASVAIGDDVYIVADANGHTSTVLSVLGVIKNADLDDIAISDFLGY